jgi:hypothetical protein
MVQKIYLLVFSGILLMLTILSPKVSSAQDFNECQRIVKDLLPVFNRSFEENISAEYEICKPLTHFITNKPFNQPILFSA